MMEQVTQCSGQTAVRLHIYCQTRNRSAVNISSLNPKYFTVAYNFPFVDKNLKIHYCRADCTISKAAGEKDTNVRKRKAVVRCSETRGRETGW